MSQNFNQKRILKNTILLYSRMLFTMWLNLYTTRLVLNNLGIEDMGVYGVVGSITSLFTVFISGITNAIQRFITFELGKKEGNTNIVFCTSLNILFIASIILIIALQIGGIWMLNNTINIPDESKDAAFWVFQLSVLTCIVNLISIPYNALIIAHEKMNAFAFISIIQSLLSCITAYSLSLFNQRLLMYAIFTAGISILIRILYQIYCHSKFKEAQYHLILNKSLISEIGKYAGISTTSSILQLISSQGLIFVINWTFGVTINAVYNIAMQLKNSILSFALNLLKAISPQITKTYANGEIESYKKLIYTGSKIEIFLIYFIIIPFFFHADFIIKLWLGKNIPQYTIEFTRCIIFVSLTYAAFEPIRAAVLATKRISEFMLIPDSFYLIVLPISYFVSKQTNNPISLIICIVIMEICTCILRLYLATKVCVFNLKDSLKYIFIPACSVAVASSIFCYLLTIIFTETLTNLFYSLIINSIFLLIFIYFLGLRKSEKNTINYYISKILQKK